jgi:hypothetical protein
LAREDPDPGKLVKDRHGREVHPNPVSQPLPEKTKDRQADDAFVSTGTVEASRIEDTAKTQEKERADGETE